MKERVSLDLTSKITTALVFVILLVPATIFLCFEQLTNCLIIFGISSAVLFLCVPMSARSVELTDKNMIVHKYAGRTTIPYTQISSVSAYHTRPVQEIRRHGIGGVLGYTGSFYNKRIGKYDSYVGNYNETFLVTLKTGKKYIFSCANHLRFISALQDECRKE